jgi:hypothetical protein
LKRIGSRWLWEQIVRPNGSELSCPAARATPHPFSRILAGKGTSNFPHVSRVSCSELLGGVVDPSTC